MTTPFSLRVHLALNTKDWRLTFYVNDALVSTSTEHANTVRLSTKLISDNVAALKAILKRGRDAVVEYLRKKTKDKITMFVFDIKEITVTKYKADERELEDITSLTKKELTWLFRDRNFKGKEEVIEDKDEN